MTTKITPALLKALRPEIEHAILTVMDDHGLSAELGNASYSADKATFKLNIVTGDGSEAKEKEWNMYARMFDLPENLIGKSFKNKGRTFTIVGIAPRSRKFPVLVERDDGREFKFKTSAAMRAN